MIAGQDDELMVSDAYERELKSFWIGVKILPKVNYMGLVHHQDAITAIIATVKQGYSGTPNLSPPSTSLHSAPFDRLRD